MLSSDAEHVWHEAAVTPVDWEWYGKNTGEFQYCYYAELLDEHIDVDLYFTSVVFTSH